MCFSKTHTFSHHHQKHGTRELILTNEVVSPALHFDAVFEVVVSEHLSADGVFPGVRHIRLVTCKQKCQTCIPDSAGGKFL
jgi:hypothetical protein